MPRVAPLLLCASFAGVASGASAQLAEADARAIECAAYAVVVNGTVESMVDMGAEVSVGFQTMAARASEDLFLAAADLFEPGSDGADEIARQFSTLLAERDAADADGTFADWFPGVVEVVQTCHLAFLDQQEQEE